MKTWDLTKFREISSKKIEPGFCKMLKNTKTHHFLKFMQNVSDFEFGAVQKCVDLVSKDA